MKYFITGTGTDVGKTYVCSAILETWRINGIQACGFKPVACGDRIDAHQLMASSATTDLSVDLVNPIWFKLPASPLAASKIENRQFDLNVILEAWEILDKKFEHVLVEGAGGWEVPLTPELKMSDLALRLGLPVLVVANNVVGTLNHTILTVNAIRAKGLTCAGIILNQVQEERDAGSICHGTILEELLNVPVLLDLMHGEDAPLMLPPELMP